MADQPPVVTVTTTLTGGTVVRWYRHPESTHYGEPHISATRDDVTIHGPMAADDWLDHVLAEAATAQQRIRDGNDVTDLATHHTGLGGRQPIRRPVMEDTNA